MTKLGSLFDGWSCPGCGLGSGEVEMVTVKTPYGPIALCRGCAPRE